MLNFPNTPPQDVRADLANLRAALDVAIPPKTLDRNVLIATWSIRALGQVTENGRRPRATLRSAV